MANGNPKHAQAKGENSMATARILVVLGVEKWTRQAMHLACAMARNLDASVAIIRLVPVSNPHQLGATDRTPERNPQCLALQHELLATAEDYQTKAEVIRLHYASYNSGIGSAAEELQALALFSPPPRHTVKWLRTFQLWRLRRAVKCPLYTLDPADQPAFVQTPKPADWPVSLPDSPALSRH